MDLSFFPGLDGTSALPGLKGPSPRLLEKGGPRGQVLPRAFILGSSLRTSSPLSQGSIPPMGSLTSSSIPSFPKEMFPFFLSKADISAYFSGHDNLPKIKALGRTWEDPLGGIDSWLRSDELLFLSVFYWTTVDLQCCVSVWCITKWFSYTYIYIHLFTYIHLHLLIPNSPSIPPPTCLQLGNHRSVLCVCESVPAS